MCLCGICGWQGEGGLKALARRKMEVPGSSVVEREEKTGSDEHERDPNSKYPGPHNYVFADSSPGRRGESEGREYGGDISLHGWRRNLRQWVS